MATRKDQVQISIAFLTDESKQYAKLINDNKAFIADIQKAKKEGKDMAEVIRQMATSGQAISKIPLDKLAPSQLIARANQLKQVLDLIPQSAPEYKQLENEYKLINNELATMRARTKGVSDEMVKLRTEGGFLTRVLTTMIGVFGGLSIDNLLNTLTLWGERLFSIGTALDTMQQKTRTVFGDAEAVVRGFAETNARDLGLAREQYVALATAAGDLLKPMGFTEEQVANLSVALTDQAGILAEWSQGKIDTVQAQEILTKALLGERDALNSLGIDIKDSLIQDELKKRGLEDLTGASKRQAEALITLDLVTKQSASANEAFGNNAESNGRRLAQLRARLAEISQTAAGLLAPAFSALITLGLRLIDWGVRFAQTLAAIPGFIRENQVQIAALVVALVSLNAQGILAAANALRLAAAQRATAIATAAQAAAQRALNFVLAANPIGLVITAVATLGAVLVTAYQRSETFRRVVVGVFAAVTDSVRNALGFFTDLGSGLVNLFTGNFDQAVSAFSNAFNRLNPAEVGRSLKESFVRGYESVPTPPAEIRADEGAARQEGSKVGAAMASGFESQFENLKKTGEKGADALAKAAKDALELRLREIEASFLKEEIVADRALFNRELNESDHARRILELKRQHYEDQIAAFRRFHQEESKEALAAQKNLLEIQRQLAPRGVAPLAPLGTVQPGQVTSQTASLTKQGDVAAADDEIKILQDKIARVVDIEQGSELLRLEIKRNALNAQLDLLRQNGLQETQEFQRILGEKVKADEEYQKTRVENERRTAELRRKIEQEALGASADFFGTFADLLSQDEKARKKNAAAIKTFQTAQVIVQGIAEVQKIWSHAADLGPIAGPIIGAIQTAVAVARSAIAIGRIQAAKFAWGGYTGIGFGAPDSTGHRPVGVVHEREWVGPRWMVESPALSPVFNTLESIRRRGFADGGFSTTPAPSVAGVTIPGFGQDMMGAFMRISEDIRGLRQDVNTWRTRLKADVSYLDIEDAGSKLNLVRDDASI